jgi:cytidyltransferase-like protein
MTGCFTRRWGYGTLGEPLRTDWAGGAYAAAHAPIRPTVQRVLAKAAAESVRDEIEDRRSVWMVPPRSLSTMAGSAARHRRGFRGRDPRGECGGLGGGRIAFDPGLAVDRGRERRAGGLRIGFTNGCFDILHPGHVHVMTRARSVCDRLVVGLNSDASVKRLKGAEQPVQDVQGSRPRADGAGGD